MAMQTIEIPEEQAQFIREIVAAGRYQDENAVVRAALQLLERDEAEYCENLEELRGEVQKGLDDIDAGRYIELNSEEQIRTYFDAVRDESQAGIERSR